MSRSGLRVLAALLGAAVIVSSMLAANAQGTQEPKPAEQPKPPAAPSTEPGKDEKKKFDEFAEVAKLVPGPAGNPECYWLGSRVVSLLYRDDLDTAFRHLDLYDRFGCPGPYVQASFRCVVKQGPIDLKADPKLPESLGGRVYACWINPGLPPATAAAPPIGTPGTSSQ